MTPYKDFVVTQKRRYITETLTRLEAAGFPTKLFYRLWEGGLTSVPEQNLDDCAALLDRSIVDARKKGYLIDAELALHSTAEIAGTRAGWAALEEEARAREVCVWTEEDELYIDGHNIWRDRFEKRCHDCGKRVEVRS